MEKTTILLVVLILLSTAGFAQAEEKELGVSLDVSYVSKWMSRGDEVWSEDGGFFETVNLDLWGTGFKVAVIHRSATGGGWVNKQRMDYMLSYSDSAFDDTPYKTKFTVGYMYKNWYDNLESASGGDKDIEMWVLKYTLPKLLGSTGLTPYGVTTYDCPAHGHDGFNKHWDGWVHRFGLGYELSVPDLPNPLHLTSEIAYTDGFRADDHDWSYATFGAFTKVKLSENMALVPGIYHQISMDDSVLKHNVTYCQISMQYKF